MEANRGLQKSIIYSSLPKQALCKQGKTEARWDEIAENKATNASIPFYVMRKCVRYVHDLIKQSPSKLAVLSHRLSLVLASGYHKRTRGECSMTSNDKDRVLVVTPIPRCLISCPFLSLWMLRCKDTHV